MMTQKLLPVALEKDNSNDKFVANLVLKSWDLIEVFTSADSDIEKPTPPILVTSVKPLEVKGRIFETLVLPQLDKSFVIKVNTESFHATGQGDSEEKAMNDIKEAIELLLEEEENPSGDIPWPEDYQ
jgi:predicted RNase H-like HicB family nuclease